MRRREVRRSSGHRGARGLKNKTGEVGSEGEGIADQDGLGGVVNAEPGRALDATMLLSGVAGFRIGLTADAQFPGIGADLSIAGETDGAIG